MDKGQKSFIYIYNFLFYIYKVTAALEKGRCPNVLDLTCGTPRVLELDKERAVTGSLHYTIITLHDYDVTRSLRYTIITLDDHYVNRSSRYSIVTLHDHYVTRSLRYRIITLLDHYVTRL